MMRASGRDRRDEELEEDIEENEEDEEEDEEEEEEDRALFVKPVFTPKHLRQSEMKKVVEEESQRQWDEKRSALMQAKKDQARALVAEVVRMGENVEDENEDANSEAGIPDDTDDMVEYEEWKIREITRIKRDTDEREQAILEQEEIKRRRNMTDEERAAEDRKLSILQNDARAERQKWGFMQKYYHKGAFYMDASSIANENDVRLKEYSAPTLEDHTDKKNLPQVMQVKNFGKRGRTKYTHLRDQDTTIKGDKRVDLKPHYKAQDFYLQRQGGAKKL